MKSLEQDRPERMSGGCGGVSTHIKGRSEKDETEKSFQKEASAGCRD